MEKKELEEELFRFKMEVGLVEVMKQIDVPYDKKENMGLYIIPHTEDQWVMHYHDQWYVYWLDPHDNSLKYAQWETKQK